MLKQLKLSFLTETSCEFDFPIKKLSSYSNLSCNLITVLPDYYSYPDISSYQNHNYKYFRSYLSYFNSNYSNSFAMNYDELSQKVLNYNMYLVSDNDRRNNTSYLKKYVLLLGQKIIELDYSLESILNGNFIIISCNLIIFLILSML